MPKLNPGYATDSIPGILQHFYHQWTLFSIEITQFCGRFGIVVGTTILTTPTPYPIFFLRGWDGNLSMEI